MLGKIIFVLAALAAAKAQIPSLGWCPDYVPMANFDMSRFMGVWYEAERYFQFSELASRCITANYTRGPDGKLRVSNEVTNRFTGIKRIVEGEIKPPASKAEEGKLQVKYTAIPLTPSTEYSVLGTDYDNYAVLWSCAGIGPVYTQNAWLMTRDRLAPGEVIQEAYGILDRYKISKRYFLKTDQADCAYLPLPEPEKEKPAAPEKPQKEKPAAPEKPHREKPAAPEKPQKEKPAAAAPVQEEVEEDSEEEPSLRSVFAIPDDSVQEKKAGPEATEKASEAVVKVPVEPEVTVPAVKALAEEDKVAAEEKKPEEGEPAVETVPERIIKVAEQVMAAAEEPEVKEEGKKVAEGPEAEPKTGSLENDR